MTVTLYQHQQDDLEFFRRYDKAALWHEVGSGKTYPAVFRMKEIISENPDGMFVIVAELSLMPQWKSVLLNVCELRDDQVQIVTGSTKKNVIPLAFRPGIRFVLVNYDFFPKIEEHLRRMVVERRLLGMMCDEAHRLKGFRGFRSKYGQRAKSIMTIAQFCKYRFALSGSPILNPNRPDVWGIYHYIDPKIFGESLWRFEDTFYLNVAQGLPYKKLVLRPDMKAEMSRRMFTVARRLLKRELPIDFPEETTIPYMVDMSPPLRKFYDDLAKKCIATVELRDGQVLEVTRAVLLARLMALQQVSSGFLRQPNDTIIRLDTKHKDSVLLSILEEIGEEPCIIWAHFTHEIAHISRLVSEAGYSMVVVDGNVVGDDRSNALRRFAGSVLENGEAPGDTQILVGQPGAAGAGLNLQRAGHSIRYSRSHNLRDFDQSKGRIHRAGEQFHDRVTYHEIITQASTDLLVYENLMGKHDLAAELTLDMLTATLRNAA